MVQEQTPWSSNSSSDSRSPQEGRARNGHRFEVWMAVVCWLVKEAMSSLSSSGVVVSVLVSPSSSSPPSSGGARIQWLMALSVRLARSHSTRADGLGRTARVMAAPRWRAIQISRFHLCWRAFADTCCPLWRASVSAAYCMVRVTAGCGRP